jgi:hypothetical protein
VAARIAAVKINIGQQKAFANTEEAGNPFFYFQFEQLIAIFVMFVEGLVAEILVVEMFVVVMVTEMVVVIFVEIFVVEVLVAIFVAMVFVVVEIFVVAVWIEM